jgi:hypothetical protein
LFREDPKLTLPPDDTVIWRYNTFTEFLAMLSEGALFFCGLDQLHDRWEGVYPKGMLDWWAENLDDGASFQGDPSGLKRKLIEKVIPSHFINSWYISEFESDAMWRLYGHKSEGIAIRSTLGKLKRVLQKGPEEIYLGKVNYIDYNHWAPPSAPTKGQALFPLEPFFWKRLGFQHENELRALLKQDSPAEGQNGINVKVDLKELLDSVYLFPDSKDWFYRLTRTLMDKFGFVDLELKRSSLGERPWQ